MISYLHHFLIETRQTLQIRFRVILKHRSRFDIPQEHLSTHSENQGVIFFRRNQPSFNKSRRRREQGSTHTIHPTSLRDNTGHIPSVKKSQRPIYGPGTEKNFLPPTPDFKFSIIQAKPCTEKIHLRFPAKSRRLLDMFLQVGTAADLFSSTSLRRD